MAPERYEVIIIIVYILGISLYHIYIKILFIFIVLKSFLLQLPSKNIMYELPKIDYDVQRWVTTRTKTWQMIILYTYILKFINGPNGMCIHLYLVK